MCGLEHNYYDAITFATNGFESSIERFLIAQKHFEYNMSLGRRLKSYIQKGDYSLRDRAFLQSKNEIIHSIKKSRVPPFLIQRIAAEYSLMKA
jgi:hypothetical protein